MLDSIRRGGESPSPFFTRGHVLQTAPAVSLHCFLFCPCLRVMCCNTWAKRFGREFVNRQQFVAMLFQLAAKRCVDAF